MISKTPVFDGSADRTSTVIVAELEAGIALAARIGATTKGERLRRWLTAVEHSNGCTRWTPESSLSNPTCSRDC